VKAAVDDDGGDDDDDGEGELAIFIRRSHNDLSSLALLATKRKFFILAHSILSPGLKEKKKKKEHVFAF